MAASSSDLLASQSTDSDSQFQKSKNWTFDALSESSIGRYYDDDDDDDDDERPDATVRLLPKQPNEFACKSCFLVKHIGQLADGEKMLCRDCV